MNKVAIIGASGYTGGELARLLSRHPHAEIVAVTSEKSKGKRIDHLFPNLAGRVSLELEPLDIDTLSGRADLFFLALPHTQAMEAAGRLIRAGKSVIDLSADFRLRDPKQYEAWYGKKHSFPELCEEAVYGLPEQYREAIKKARLVANPGCYPTGALLGLLPLISDSRIEADSIIIDAKSGVSGAGRSPDQATHFPEAHDALSAYKIGKHRHLPEIEQELSGSAEKPVELTFTPHLIPLNRGLLSTIYVRTKQPVTINDMREIFEKRYSSEPFVQILPDGSLPNVRNIRGSNDCHIGLALDEHRKEHRTLIVVTAIDNLVKGAAGQAVQNMNLMLGLDESTGLDAPGLFP